MMASANAAHDDLCAALRGAATATSPAAIALARRHRIHLVLAQSCGDRVRDATARAALGDELRRAAIADLFRERELRRLIGLLEGAGVTALLVKGAGLAYTVYGAAHLRPRADLDLLIARSDLETADRALTAAGWRPIPEQSREAVTTQRHYALEGAPLCPEHLDLHWKISVPHAFRDALTFDELASRAVSIGVLGGARTLSAPDALLLACLHRVAHHQDAIDLLWLWDIHLLASGLTDAERAFFVDLAGRRSMRAVCARGIELASNCFATPRATGLLAGLAPLANAAPEPSAAFLGGGGRQIDLLRRELSSLGGVRTRFQLLAAHLVPGRAYMKSIYPGWPALALPLAYIHRMVRGAPAWFRRPTE